MLGEEAWGVVSVPIHPKGVQCIHLSLSLRNCIATGCNNPIQLCASNFAVTV